MIGVCDASAFNWIILSNFKIIDKKSTSKLSHKYLTDLCPHAMLSARTYVYSLDD